MLADNKPGNRKSVMALLAMRAAITVGKNTYLPEQLFMVMATQNPLSKQEPPPPEAQLDRFYYTLILTTPMRTPAAIYG